MNITENNNKKKNPTIFMDFLQHACMIKGQHALISSPPSPSILVSTRKQWQAAGKKTKIAAILHVKRNACGRISLEFYKFDEVFLGHQSC